RHAALADERLDLVPVDGFADPEEHLTRPLIVSIGRRSGRGGCSTVPRRPFLRFPAEDARDPDPTAPPPERSAPPRAPPRAARRSRPAPGPAAGRARPPSPPRARGRAGTRSPCPRRRRRSRSPPGAPAPAIPP